MATHNPNGRNVGMPDENRASWRPQDQGYSGRGDDEGWRDRGGRDDRDEGRGGGRRRGARMDNWPEDRGERSMRNQGDMGNMRQEDRGGYWMDRPDRGSEWGQGYGDMDRGGGYGFQQGGRQGYGNQGWGGPGHGGQGYGQERTGYGGRDFDQGYGRQQGRMSGMSGGMGLERGGHRGKGPMGYTRSDERIRESVCEALSDDDNVDASQIEVTVRNGEVILSGTVDDRQSKRLAEDVVERLPGVKDVQNQIKVQERREQRGSQGMQGSQSTQGIQTHQGMQGTQSGNQVGKDDGSTATSTDKRHRA